MIIICIYLLSMAGSWDSSVSMLTLLWAGEPRGQVLISGSGTWKDPAWLLNPHSLPPSSAEIMNVQS